MSCSARSATSSSTSIRAATRSGEHTRVIEESTLAGNEASSRLTTLADALRTAREAVDRAETAAAELGEQVLIARQQSQTLECDGQPRSLASRA